jgi:hypothetical protein
VTFTFSSLVARTPLRWVLGGPVRAEQRASYNGTSYNGASYNGTSRAPDNHLHADADDTLSAIDLGRRATRR